MLIAIALLGQHAEPVDTSTSHLGFRCVVRQKQPV
jgi:hypothetical protein